MIVPQHIKFLIRKWKTGRLNEEEQKHLDTWYNTPMPSDINLEGREDQVRSSLFRRIESELGNDGLTGVRRLSSWTKVAASVLLLLGLSLMLYHYNNDPIITQKNRWVENMGPGIRKIILPDSSIVWLKAGSRFSYPADFGPSGREVTLYGEGLFEITHDKSRPFVVRSGHYQAKVLGTSFNIRTGKEPEEFNISVLTGKVQVTREKGAILSKIFLVAAHQEFRGLDEEVHTLSGRKDVYKLEKLTEGTEYNMAFTNASIEEIMQRFEEKFDVQFVGYTGEYKSCRITADLTAQSLEKSLQIFCLAINANYNMNNKKIRLTGGGCL